MAATTRRPVRRIAFDYGETSPDVMRFAARPAWLANMRAAARKRVTIGLPSPREEQWKYTNLQPLAERRFEQVGGPPANGAALKALARAQLGRDAHRLVFVNGRYAPELSALGELPQGVRLESLAEALAKDDPTLEWLIERSDVTRSHVLAAYNTAFFADGVVLRVGDRVALDRPVHLVFIGAPGAAPIAYHPRLIVEAARCSSLMLIESHIGIGGAYWSNPVTELGVGTEAVVCHCKLQDEAEEAHHLALVDVSVAQGARYESTVLSLGASLSRHEIVVRLEGEHAEARLNGGYLIGGKQHCDNTTRIEHLVPHGTAREVYKGVLDGEARGAFQGTIVVHKGAVKTDAHQLSRALMLSKRAEADSKPELEIYADDVKCSHGASAGALDPLQMFYLRSRGIDEAAARALIVEGFIGEAIEGIADEAVRGYFAARIGRWLEGHAGGRP